MSSGTYADGLVTREDLYAWSGLSFRPPWHRRVAAWLVLGLTAHGCACAPVTPALTPEQTECVALVFAREAVELAKCEATWPPASIDLYDCKRAVLDYYDAEAMLCAPS